MEIAGIKKDVSIIGRGNNLEIWDTRRFEEYTGGTDDFDDVYYNSIQPGVVRD
jgi:DNA-binding transcriptional regulator/RsmH inhibitor MraZ